MRSLFRRTIYGLITSHSDLMALIDKCPAGTDVIAIHGRHLTLRGIVDEDFIREAERLLPGQADYLFVNMVPGTIDDPRLEGCEDSGHKMMREELNERLGMRVALGACPNYVAKDNAVLVSFAKGGIDGPR